MFHDENLPYPRRAPLLAALWCLVAVLPIQADDAAPSPAQISTSAPTLNAPTPVLRPVPSPDSALASASPAGNISVAPTAVPDASAPTTSTSPATPPSTGAAPSATPSPNAMVNLVNLLVAQHVLTQEAGDRLIKQANEEADTARAQIASTQAVAERALTAQSAQAPAPAPAPASAPASDDEVQVAYVPDVVKIRFAMK